MAGKTKSESAIYPLSPPQLWWQWTDHYILNLSFSFNIKKEMNPSLFQMAWQHVVEHQPMLRAVFPEGKQSNHFRVLEKGLELPVHYEDLSRCSPFEFQKQLEEIQDQLNESVELTQWPLLRTALLKKGPSEFVMLLIFPTYVGDLYCLMVLMKEFVRFYEQLEKGETIQQDISEVDLSLYHNFLEQLPEETLNQYRDKWKTQFPPEGFKIPADFAKGYNHLYTERMYVFNWPLPPKQKKEEVDRKYKPISLYECLWLAVYRATAAWTGKEKVVICERTHGRHLPMKQNLFHLCNFYVVDYPVFLEPSTDGSVYDQLLQVRDCLADSSLQGAIYNHLYATSKGDWPLPHEVSPIRIDFAPKQGNNFYRWIEFLRGDGRFRVDGSEVDLIRPLLNTGKAFRPGLGKRDRLYLLDVTSVTHNDELIFGVFYSANYHRFQTIKEWSDRVQAEIEEIVRELYRMNVRLIV